MRPTTYGSPNYSGGPGLQIFSTNDMGTQGIALWRDRFRCARLRCSPSDETIVFGGLLILVRHVSKLHIDLDQLENDATPSFTPVATSESTFFLPSVFQNSTTGCSQSEASAENSLATTYYNHDDSAQLTTSAPSSKNIEKKFTTIQPCY